MYARFSLGDMTSGWTARALEWWEEWVARPPLGIFSALLICLSYLPMAKGVEVASTRYRFGDESATPAEPNVK